MHATATAEAEAARSTQHWRAAEWAFQTADRRPNRHNILITCPMDANSQKGRYVLIQNWKVGRFHEKKKRKNAVCFYPAGNVRAQRIRTADEACHPSGVLVGGACWR